MIAIGQIPNETLERNDAMNFYITLKRAIVDAPFAAVHAIGTACSRFAPPYSRPLTLSKSVFFLRCW